MRISLLSRSAYCELLIYYDVHRTADVHNVRNVSQLFLVYTLEKKVSIQSTLNIVTMDISIISWSSPKLGYVEALGQIQVKPNEHFRGHNFDSICMILGQKSIIKMLRLGMKSGFERSKTRSLSQILEKS